MDKNDIKLFETFSNFVDVLPSIVTNTFIFYETFIEQKRL